jgi:DNA-binding CsgD family transcriptional regulator
VGPSHLASAVNQFPRHAGNASSRPSGRLHSGGCADAVREKDSEYTGRLISLPSDYSHGLLMAGLEALDLLGVGLVITNLGAQLLHANRTGKAILQARDGLSVDSAGVLRSSRGTSPTLAELVGRLAIPPTAALSAKHKVGTLRRPSGGALTMFVCRPSTASYQWSAGMTVPILLLDQARNNPAPPSLMRALFGLTCAESRLANLLMDGVALQDCSDPLGVSRNTLSFHMKNIFRKTGTRSQNHLVSLLFRSIALREASSSLPSQRLVARMRHLSTSGVSDQSKNKLERDARPGTPVPLGGL